jgi:ABC-type glutathione transport system ATPase component
MSLIIAEAKNILDYDRVVGLDEVFGKIDKVTAKEILELSNDIFSRENLSSLSFLPED